MELKNGQMKRIEKKKKLIQHSITYKKLKIKKKKEREREHGW